MTLLHLRNHRIQTSCASKQVNPGSSVQADVMLALELVLGFTSQVAHCLGQFQNESKEILSSEVMVLGWEIPPPDLGAADHRSLATIKFQISQTDPHCGAILLTRHRVLQPSIQVDWFVCLLLLERYKLLANVALSVCKNTGVYVRCQGPFPAQFGRTAITGVTRSMNTVTPQFPRVPEVRQHQ